MLKVVVTRPPRPLGVATPSSELTHDPFHEAAACSVHDRPNTMRSHRHVSRRAHQHEVLLLPRRRLCRRSARWWPHVCPLSFSSSFPLCKHRSQHHRPPPPPLGSPNGKGQKPPMGWRRWVCAGLELKQLPLYLFRSHTSFLTSSSPLCAAGIVSSSGGARHFSATSRAFATGYTSRGADAEGR